MESLENVTLEDSTIHVGVLNRQVVLRLEQPVQYLSLTPAQAWKLGKELQTLAHQADDRDAPLPEVSQPYSVHLGRSKDCV